MIEMLNCKRRFATRQLIAICRSISAEKLYGCSNDTKNDRANVWNND